MKTHFAPSTLGFESRRKELGWVTLTEVDLKPTQVFPTHRHEFPRMTILRRGAFDMRLPGESVICDTGGVFFKREGQRHSNVVGPVGAQSLILELRPRGSHANGLRASLPTGSFLARSIPITFLAREIEYEFEQTDHAANVALEGLALELLAKVFRLEERERVRPMPQWLDRVLERIHGEFSEPLTLSILSKGVGVDPVFLSQTFRRYFGSSLGAYIRRMRLQWARSELKRSDKTISQIAQAAGFYDHSHFSRSFKREFGFSPSHFRNCVPD